MTRDDVIGAIGVVAILVTLDFCLSRMTPPPLPEPDATLVACVGATNDIADRYAGELPTRMVTDLEQIEYDKCLRRGILLESREVAR